MRLAGEKGEGALAWKLHLLSGEGGGGGKKGSFCMAFHCIHSSATYIQQHGKKTLLFFVHILSPCLGKRGRSDRAEMERVRGGGEGGWG